MKGRCELCGREQVELTRHHLIPRARHAKPRTRRAFDSDEMTGRIAMLCRGCHKFVHSALTEQQLANSYNTIEALRGHPEIRKFADWISERPAGLHVRTRLPRR